MSTDSSANLAYKSRPKANPPGGGTVSTPVLANTAPDTFFLFLAAAIGSFISIVISDFLFPVANDQAYLAFVARLSEVPQFANNAYMQTFRFFPSGFWMALQGFAPHLNLYWTFFALFFISHLLTFLGFLFCARLLGDRSLSHYVLFSCIIAASFLMASKSLAGGNGLFIDYFTHTEIGNGLFLLSLSQAIDRRPAVAMAILGLIGFVSPFFAVWVTVPLAAIFLLQLFRNDIPASRLLKGAAVGSIIAAVICSPVIASIVKNAHNLVPAGFDYVAYLREYMPRHMLSDTISLSEKLGLAAVAAAAIIGFILLNRICKNSANDYFIISVVATVLVYCFGIILPTLTHSITALNLHLLRSGGLLHLLCVLATATLATRWWFGGEKANADVKGPILAAILTVPTFAAVLRTHVPLYYPALTALLVLLLAAWRKPALLVRAGDQGSVPEQTGSALKTGVMAWMAFSIILQSVVNFWFHQSDREWISDWTAVAHWARSNTNPNAMFMVPVMRESAVFEFEAQRAAWVDWKRGDAVMWDPSYYNEWHQRMIETKALSSLDDKVRYAGARNIPYVINLCGDGDGGGQALRRDIVFQSGLLCVS